jgi:hypothetical protein
MKVAAQVVVVEKCGNDDTSVWGGQRITLITLITLIR